MLFASGSGAVAALEFSSGSAARARPIAFVELRLRSAGDVSCPFEFFDSAEVSEDFCSGPVAEIDGSTAPLASDEGSDVGGVKTGALSSAFGRRRRPHKGFARHEPALRSRRRRRCARTRGGSWRQCAHTGGGRCRPGTRRLLRDDLADRGEDLLHAGFGVHFKSRHTAPSRNRDAHVPGARPCKPNDRSLGLIPSESMASIADMVAGCKKTGNDPDPVIPGERHSHGDDGTMKIRLKSRRRLCRPRNGHADARHFIGGSLRSRTSICS